MKNTFLILYSYLPNATTSEKTIIKYIIDNPKEVINSSVRQVASNTYSSAATIIRLCKKLEYKGFRDLKENLIYDFAIKDFKNTDIVNEIYEKDDTDTIIKKVSSRNISSIESSASLLSAKDIDETVSLIEKSKKLYFFGIGASLLVARDACMKFMRVNKNSIVFDDWHLQKICASTVTKNDLAIMFSYSGQTKEMIECSKKLKQNNCKIILITGYVNTELSNQADIVHQVMPYEESFRSGAMSSRMSQMNVIDIIYTKYINNNYNESLKYLNYTNLKA